MELNTIAEIEAYLIELQDKIVEQEFSLDKTKAECLEVAEKRCKMRSQEIHKNDKPEPTRFLERGHNA